ncbi:MAG: hypothetical protein PHD73_11800 [Sediminibacterium sp.]|nr:hypothetical protein [Sediminibacterium sp.]
MNWILLIIAGLFEGTALIGILFFKDPASFWRVFFLTTLIASIVGLKWVSHQQ